MKKIRLSEYKVYKTFVLIFAGWGFFDFIHKLAKFLNSF